MSDVQASSGLSAWLRSLVLVTCEAGRILPDALAARLGMRLSPGYRGYAEVADLPAGVLQVVLGLDEDRGPVRFVEARFEEWVDVPVADLQELLADGREQPPLHRGDAEQIIYDLAGSSRRCRVAVELRPARSGPPPDGADRARSRRVAALTVLP